MSLSTESIAATALSDDNLVAEIIRTGEDLETLSSKIDDRIPPVIRICNSVCNRDGQSR